MLEIFILDPVIKVPLITPAGPMMAPPMTALGAVMGPEESTSVNDPIYPVIFPEAPIGP